MMASPPIYVDLDARLRNIRQMRQQHLDSYPTCWESMLHDWQSHASEDGLWLMYAANYLGKLAGVRWAMDPIRLNKIWPDAPSSDLAALQHLDVVLLTHRHSDHVDAELWRLLDNPAICWVVPESMLAMFRDATAGQTRQIITPRPGQPMACNALRITPFAGLHWEWADDAPAEGPPTAGTDAMGYLIESAKQRWLFPGDTRTYDARRLPDFRPVDQVFAHVWLGRQSALWAEPPKLDALVQFIVDLKPTKRVHLAHLYESSRPPEDLWVRDHARQVMAHLQPRLPGVSLAARDWWQRIES